MEGLPMRINPESLAKASSRHPWRVITAWLAVMIVMVGVAATLLSGVVTTATAFTDKPDSIKAQDVIDRQFSAKQAGVDTEYVIVGSPTLTVDDPAFESYVGQLQAALAAKTDIVAAPPVTYYALLNKAPADAKELVSVDRSTTLIPVPILNNGSGTVKELRATLAANTKPGFSSQLAGPATLNADFATVAQQDGTRGESIGVMVGFLVLIVVFGAIVAALLPIGMAVVAITVALGVTALIGQIVHFNVFVTDIIAMIGLAVGIDYSLFIVSRFREERRKGFEKMDAIAAAGATASRAVFFSGMTVVLALLGMFIIPTTIFRSLAAGAIFVTLVAILASMTLLPAVLAKLGDRINWPRLSKRARSNTPADGIGGFWDKVSKGVMHRPVVFLVVSVAILLGLGSFYLQMNKGSSTTINQLPDSIQSKTAFQTLEQKFSEGVAYPASIIVTGDVGSAQAKAAVTTLRSDIAKNPTFAPATLVATSTDGTAVEINAFFNGDYQGDAAIAAIKDLRSTTVPSAFSGVPGVQVYVGGQSAIYTDFLNVTNTYQWIVLAFVLTLSFLLLMVVFRSIVVPIKAIIMNLLSVVAAYGAITLVFQKGVGIGFFDSIGFHFHQSPSVEAWLPLFLFSILFGLSMDYHVFLLSRIREEYDKTHDNTEAVAYGVRTTAGLITGAATIMVVVFIGFASGSLGPLQQMGFGLAVAVFLDATIVRTLLVPASMRLLGDANWYLPSWLEWLPKLNVEGHEPELAIKVPDTAAELVEANE
jgi:putative drug exporter of the RND superfamily